MSQVIPVLFYSLTAIVAVICFLLVLTCLMAAPPAILFYLTPLSVASNEMKKAPARVQRIFRALVFLPASVVLISYCCQDDVKGFSEETFRIVVLMCGALLCLFPRVRSYCRGSWAYSGLAAAVWLLDVFMDNETWAGFGSGFVGPT